MRCWSGAWCAGGGAYGGCAASQRQARTMRAYVFGVAALLRKVVGSVRRALSHPAYS